MRVKPPTSDAVPYLPFYFRDFMVSTDGWTATARGCYLILLGHQWDKRELEDDVDELRRMCHIEKAEWAPIWRKLEPKFPITKPGIRCNPRLTHIRQHTFRVLEAKRAGGRATGKRNKKNLLNAVLQDSTPDCIGHAEAEARKKVPLRSVLTSRNKSLSTKTLSSPQLSLLTSVDGLKIDVWERWLDYRKRIKKPIKTASMEAAARKLAAFGDQQALIVDNSIAEGYQGLWKPQSFQDPKTRRLAGDGTIWAEAKSLASEIGFRAPHAHESASSYASAVKLAKDRPPTKRIAGVAELASKMRMS